MSLADLVVDGAEIQHGDKAVTVHPLTIEGVAVLLKDHASELRGLFEGKVPMDSLMQSAPDFVAVLIAAATDGIDPATIQAAKKIPVGLQLAILNKVWELSAIDPEFVGKFVSRLVEGLAQAATGFESGQSKLPPAQST